MKPRPEFLAEVLEKFAVSGSLYARALGNTAQRTGGRIAPKLLGRVAEQPRALRSPFLSGEARAPGALTPTQQQQGLQQMMSNVPWAGSEHGGDPHAAQTYTRELQNTGRAYQAPPGFEKDLMQRFGVPYGHPSYAPFAATQASGALDPTVSNSPAQGTVAAGPRARRRTG